MEKIIVLDFSGCDVYLFDFNTSIYSNDNIEDFFDMVNEKFDLNLSEKNCLWMNNKNLSINFYNKI